MARLTSQCCGEWDPRYTLASRAPYSRFLSTQLHSITTFKQDLHVWRTKREELPQASVS